VRKKPSETLPLPGLIDRERESMLVFTVLTDIFTPIASGIAQIPNAGGLTVTLYTVYVATCERILRDMVIHFMDHDIDIESLLEDIWLAEVNT